MTDHFPPICRRCGKYPVEVIEDWQSDCCGYCNDRRIEHANERREWDYYHPKGDEEPKP